LIADLDYLRIERDAVVFRRWPEPARRVPRDEVDRFIVLPTAPEEKTGECLALLMKDGKSIRVPSVDSEPGPASVRMNNELIM
jgi:hypothetical protein